MRGRNVISNPTRTRPWRPLLILALHLLLLLVLLAAGSGLWLGERRTRRGVSYGPPPALTPAIHERLGVNVALERYDEVALAAVLDNLQAANLRWLRQRFLWSEIEPQRGQFRWAVWDRIVQAVAGRDLHLIAVLDTSPAWARGEADAANPFAPPHERADFGRFVAAFARRYSEQVDFYQIWDEPNIAPHWGARPADPADYLGLLREGYVQVKAADPTAWVVLAGLAPTVESGGANLSDIAYLDHLYRLGAAEWFDVAAAKPYGFDARPDDPRLEAQVLNFGRTALLREVMEEHGDGQTPLWAVEFGWNALPAGWTGAPSIWGQVDEATQADYVLGASQRARRDWPWLELLLWASYQPAVSPDDAHWGFALADAQGRPRPALAALRQAAAEATSLLPPGVHTPDHPALRYSGGWRVTAEAADVGASGDRVEFDFLGTRLDLEVQRGPYWAYLTVTVDGQPANALPVDTDGQANLILYDPLAAPQRVTLARGLQDTVHRVRLVATGGWGQWALRRVVVSRERSAWPLWLLGALAVLALLTLGNGLRLALRPEAQESLHRAAVGMETAAARFRHLDERVQVACVVGAAALFAFSPWLPLDLLSLGLLALLLALRLELILPLIAFAIPFFLRPKAILGRYFSHLEILTLLGTAIFAWQTVWWKNREARGKKQEAFASCILHLASCLDFPVLALIAVSALSLLTADNTGVARREFRVVIVEAALAYLLVSRLRRADGRPLSLWPLADGLVLGALMVSLVGLWQLVTGQGRVDVEGVWRVRAFYGSPNNLGLYLDRIVPLLGAVAAYGRTRWRRWAYGLSLIPIGLACVFTFSKGALLLGLPAALLFLGLAGSLAGGGRKRWRPLVVALGLLLLAALAMIPLFRTERFAGLLDFTRGTSFIRLQLWRGALNMALDHPWLGVGPDNFLYAYRTRYVLPVAWEELNLSHPHNLVLDFWTRLGLLGLAVGIWLMVAGFRAGWAAWRRTEDADRRALLLGLLASLVAMLAHGLIDNSIFLVDLAFVFMLTLGVFQRERGSGVGVQEGTTPDPYPFYQGRASEF
ncbi:MAG: O-antigen ligase family protein [Anaerolineae bacterium]|nr:O-antigen ligase family protein [Anaerolineae bacterium]